MTLVTPRWEWRTFGDGCEGVERLMLATPHDVRRSHETYLICDTSDLNVKIRAGQLDIKQLQRADRGLELWAPVLKAPFPVDRPTLEKLFELWRLPLPAALGGSATAVVDRITTACPLVHAIDVDKTRHGTVIDGCAVELASLVAAGQPLRTVAVEMEDPDRVLRTVRVLGLSGFDNVNYVTALKRLLASRGPSSAPMRPGGRSV